MANSKLRLRVCALVLFALPSLMSCQSLSARAGSMNTDPTYEGYTVYPTVTWISRAESQEVNSFWTAVGRLLWLIDTPISLAVDTLLIPVDLGVAAVQSLADDGDSSTSTAVASVR